MNEMVADDSAAVTTDAFDRARIAHQDALAQRDAGANHLATWYAGQRWRWLLPSYWTQRVALAMRRNAVGWAAAGVAVERERLIQATIATWTAQGDPDAVALQTAEGRIDAARDARYAADAQLHEMDRLLLLCDGFLRHWTQASLFRLERNVTEEAGTIKRQLALAAPTGERDADEEWRAVLSAYVQYLDEFLAARNVSLFRTNLYVLRPRLSAAVAAFREEKASATRERNAIRERLTARAQRLLQLRQDSQDDHGDEEDA